MSRIRHILRTDRSEDDRINVGAFEHIVRKHGATIDIPVTMCITVSVYGRNRSGSSEGCQAETKLLSDRSFYAKLGTAPYHFALYIYIYIYVRQTHGSGSKVNCFRGVAFLLNL